MASYKAPKAQLHREFLYLDHETVLNSLSALESGAIDEIIQKANAAREGGFAGGLAVGPVEASASRKKTTNIEEEIVRTRTVFSAFEAWRKHLDEANAIGRFDGWDQQVRDQLSVGDTVEFVANLRLTPLHMVLRSFLSFAEQANTPGSLLQQKGEDLKETKKGAQQISAIIRGGEPEAKIALYMAPFGEVEPRIVASLDEQYMVRSGEDVEGEFHVIAQVEQLLTGDETIPAIRVMRNVPPTPMEIATTSEALGHFKEPASDLGLTIEDNDILIPAPAVQVRPVAIYR